MSEGQTPEAAKPARRWMKPLLIISLALNLLFVGLIAGSIWKHRHRGAKVAKHKAFEATIEQIMTELPAGKRQTAESVLGKLRSEVIPRAGGKRKAVAKVVEALKADPYNEKSLADALAGLRQLRNDVHVGMHELSLDLVRDMTPQERHRLLEIFRSKRHPGGRYRQRATTSE